jgi:hypothetical protein
MEIGRWRGDGEIEKKREREERDKGRRKGYLTGGKQELKLHVDIKIEREGKRKGLFDRQARIEVACRYKYRERGEGERTI